MLFIPISTGLSLGTSSNQKEYLGDFESWITSRKNEKDENGFVKFRINYQNSSEILENEHNYVDFHIDPLCYYEVAFRQRLPLFVIPLVVLVLRSVQVLYRRSYRQKAAKKTLKHIMAKLAKTGYSTPEYEIKQTVLGYNGNDARIWSQVLKLAEKHPRILIFPENKKGVALIMWELI